MDSLALIEGEIEDDPRRPGPANARLRGSGVPVWAIIGYYLDVARGDTREVARAYDVSLNAVLAAVQFYERHRAEIDGRRGSNRAVAG
jgi:uncharacterized protein (DUF433 family)